MALRYAEDWSSGGFVNEMLPEFLKVPMLWGHTHDSFDYQVEGCRVISNPRGYMNWHGEFENKDFNPAWWSRSDQGEAADQKGRSSFRSTVAGRGQGCGWKRQVRDDEQIQDVFAIHKHDLAQPVKRAKKGAWERAETGGGNGWFDLAPEKRTP